MDYYSKYFVPFPRLRTPDLILRRFKRGDVEDLYDYCKRPESSKYSDWEPHGSKKDTKSFVYWMLGRYLKHEGYTFAVEYYGRVIGTASFMKFDECYGTVEIGYGLNSDYWHKGLGTQVVSALLHFAFKKVGVQRVYARALPENQRSVNLLKKCGFTHEGTTRRSLKLKGEYVDVATFGMLKEEYYALVDKKGEK